MKKYRVKNDDGRIIGPLQLADLVQLQEKNEISATSLFQVFPLGDWDSISNFQEIQKAFTEVPVESTQTITENVQVNPDATEFREFKFDRRVNNLVDYGELERRHRIEKEKEEKEKVAREEKASELEKTRIIKASDLKVVDKTRIVRREDLIEDDTGVDFENDQPVAPVLKEKEVIEVEDKIDVDEKTTMVSLSELIPVSEKDDYKDLEKELILLENADQASEKNRKKNSAKKTKSLKEVPIKSKKNLSIILFVIVALIFLLY